MNPQPRIALPATPLSPEGEGRAAARGGRGVFITLEGGEGAGKSTQSRRLAERLRGLGHEVVTTREPGGSPGAEIIRHVLLSGAAKPLGPEAEAVLFSAARADHLDVTIRPALAQGAVVICDRFADSTRAYQGAAGSVDHRFIRALEEVTVGETRPDLTLVLDLPPEDGLARAEARAPGAADRFESEAITFHQRLREAFRMLAQEEPTRCVLIDARADVDTVAARIWQAVEEKLRVRLSLSEAAAP
ncbi:dTMP kinase [Ancylobacter sp. 6x-1]|uniref:Thymidylate kinase n=1 Tax=Ancylobacter crimeensis TaxID=2579147 RepID=A0ABT0DCY8_9HYPH|nr:dTMP kinase [Ancylobacter crimeensis]MCK0197810.1 dTMP kinase [Ancylobacter crimeensis]